MTLGDDFRTARIEADMSLKEASRMLGRSIMTLQRIEKGDQTINERTRSRAEQVLVQLRLIVQRKAMIV